MYRDLLVSKEEMQRISSGESYRQLEHRNKILVSRLFNSEVNLNHDDHVKYIQNYTTLNHGINHVEMF